MAYMRSNSHVICFFNIQYGCALTTCLKALICKPASMSGSPPPILRSRLLWGGAAIIIVIIPGGLSALMVEKELVVRGFDVRSIVAPTVAEGTERLRICVHAHNTKAQVDALAVNIRSLLAFRKCNPSRL